MSARSFASWSLCAQSPIGLRTLHPGQGTLEASATRSTGDFAASLSAELFTGDFSSAVAAASWPLSAAPMSREHRTRGELEKKSSFISTIRLIVMLHKAKTAMRRLWSRWTAPASKPTAKSVGTLTRVPDRENQATPRPPSPWPSVSSPPGNPLANCRQQFSESYASDRQALMRDESTYV